MVPHRKVITSTSASENFRVPTISVKIEIYRSSFFEHRERMMSLESGPSTRRRESTNSRKCDQQLQRPDKKGLVGDAFFGLDDVRDHLRKGRKLCYYRFKWNYRLLRAGIFWRFLRNRGKLLEETHATPRVRRKQNGAIWHGPSHIFSNSTSLKIAILVAC